MGRTAIMMVFVLLIVVGTISIAMHRKQHDAVESLVELTYSKQARHLTNSYVRHALYDLRNIINNNGGITDVARLGLAISQYNNRTPITDIQNFPNSTVGLGIVCDTYDGVVLAPNEFVVYAISTVNADDGNVYSTRTNIMFEYLDNATSPSLIDPVEITTVPTNRVNVFFRTNEILSSGHLPSSVNNNYFHTEGHLTSAATTDVVPNIGRRLAPMDPLHKDVFISRYRNTIRFSGSLPTNTVLICNYQTRGQNSPNRETATYPIKIIVLDNDVLLEASLISSEYIDIYVRGDVRLGQESSQGPSFASRQIHANIYSTRPAPSNWGRVTNKSGTWLWNIPIDNFNELVNAALEEDPTCCPNPDCPCFVCTGFCDPDFCDHTIPVPSSFLKGVKAWIELPVEINP